MQAFGFYLFYVFNWAFSRLPLEALYGLSDFAYLFAYHVLRYRRAIVRENLVQCFPEKSSEEIRILEKKFYRHFTDIFFETTKITWMPQKDLSKRVHYKGLELLRKYFSDGKSVITLLGHYGNWEWHAGFPKHSPHQSMAAFLPLNNRHFNEWMIRQRRRFGAELIPSRDVIRWIFQKQKQQALINCAFVADQCPQIEHTHYWTNFLGRDTPVFVHPEGIARKFNFAVVYVRLRKLKRGYYEAELVELAEDAGTTTEYEVTERFLRELENQILDQPEYWLWSHRRWKFNRERWHAHKSRKQAKQEIPS